MNLIGLKDKKQNKYQQLICAILAENQLVVIVFPWRLQIVNNQEYHAYL